jgi:hypothetical protein
MPWRGKSLFVVLSVVTLAGCGSGGSASSPTATATTFTSPTATPRPLCPGRDGGECLGDLQPGTFLTVTFHPEITYTVPAGWANYEDLPGNFLLIPPGGDAAGVNPGTSDFIGIYSGVSAEKRECSGEEPAPGVAMTPAAIAAYWATIPSIKVTATRSATIGGLTGVVVDLVPNLAHHGACSNDDSSPYGYEPLIAGVGPADLEHGMIENLFLRVYLLSWTTTAAGLTSTSVVAIEIDDVHGGTHLDTYSQLASALTFGS